MPNLWTKTTQKIAEAFNGPRTRDVEFDSKMEEMKIMEKAISGLRQAIQNFSSNSLAIKNLCRDIYGCIRTLYDKKSPYHSIANEIFDTHIEIEKIYETTNTNMLNLFSRTSEWNQMFTKAKALLQQREEKRKDFDHYDEKLGKIYKAKMEKIRKNQSESNKEIELLERNELKYKKATEEYIKLSMDCYKTTSIVMENRYKIVNPVVGKFILVEKQFFENIARLFKKFDKLDERFTDIFNSQPEPKITYDPCNYVRGGKLVRSHNEDEYDNYNSNQGAKDSTKKNTINRNTNLEINNNLNSSNNNRSKSINVKNNNLGSAEKANKPIAKKDTEASKYRVSEFKSLDDFLNVKENETNKAKANINQGSQNNKVLDPNWNVRLSSVEKFEHIPNNFSATNEFLTDFSSKAELNTDNNLNNQGVNRNIMNPNSNNNFNFNNNNNDFINLNQIVNEANSAGYPSLGEEKNTASLGFNSLNNNNNNNVNYSNQRMSADYNFLNLGNTFSSGNINNNNNNNPLPNRVGIIAPNNLQNSGQQAMPVNNMYNPNRQSNINNFPPNHNSNWDQSNNLSSPPVVNETVQIPYRNPINSHNNFNNINQQDYNNNNIFNNQPNSFSDNPNFNNLNNNNNNNNYAINANLQQGNMINNNNLVQGNALNSNKNLPNDDLFKDFFY